MISVWLLGSVAGTAAVAIAAVVLAVKDRQQAAAISIVRPDEAADVGDANVVVKKQLAIVNGWAHTLEERWEVLDDADKRMAIGIIRRTSEDAVVRVNGLVPRHHPLSA